MSNEDASSHVGFNGEIYNHRARRAELQGRGHVFRGTSDTEVLVHLYEELGERMAPRLRGIFAFAIYDRPRRRLLLARDRFGVKPLFYTVHDGQWVFASEIKAIAALPSFQPRLDRQARYDFLGLGYVPEPATGFANVQALAKGSTLVIDPEGHRGAEFHSVRASPDGSRTLADAVEAASAALLDAVACQSGADVPVAGLLSGRIDPSPVGAARERATGAPPTTLHPRLPPRTQHEPARSPPLAPPLGSRPRT